LIIFLHKKAQIFSMILLVWSQFPIVGISSSRVPGMESCFFKCMEIILPEKAIHELEQMAMCQRRVVRLVLYSASCKASCQAGRSASPKKVTSTPG
jgi:hypothetical protein